MSGQFSTLLSRDFADLLHITLVSDENFADARVCKPFNLMHPLTHIVERVTICHIIHNNDSVSPSVIAACQSAETLLACCVPNLQLYCLVIERDGFNFL
jgi:hypothetical protein